MKAILTDIHEHGFATVRDHPTLVETHVQEALAKAADAVGLIFSYDALTQSATFVRETQMPKYGLKERVSLLNAWLYLVFRAKANVTTEQDDRWLRLTPEGTKAMREAQEMTLTAGRLHTAFPILYPHAKDAQQALSNLERRGLVRSRDEGGIKTYTATPLLSHVVNEDEALNLVFGHLRGQYKHLMPKRSENATLETEVLELIRNLPTRTATADLIAERLGKPRRVIHEALDKLRDAKLVNHEAKGARGGTYTLAEQPDLDAEVEP